MQQHTTIKGLVIREVDFGDTDRYITVLTEGGSKIEVLCRGVRGRGARLAAAVRLFCYAELTLYAGRGKYTLNDASLITSFWGVTQDIEAYALCCYFAELTALVTETDENCPAVTVLTLHALYALCEKKRGNTLVKAAYELRLMSACGFQPQLGICGVCGQGLSYALFSAREGTIACEDCVRRLEGDWLPLGAGTLSAMRHIVSCDVRRIFSFTLGASSRKQLAEVCERYTLYYMDKGFDSLALYRSLQQPIDVRKTGAKNE